MQSLVVIKSNYVILMFFFEIKVGCICTSSLSILKTEVVTIRIETFIFQILLYLFSLHQNSITPNDTSILELILNSLKPIKVLSSNIQLTMAYRSSTKEYSRCSYLTYFLFLFVISIFLQHVNCTPRITKYNPLHENIGNSKLGKYSLF